MEYWNAGIHSQLYRPLEGELPLRLLRLEAGQPGQQPIACSLIPAALTTAEPLPVYEAASYTWGSPESPQPILCNGLRMTVQKSAHDMLDGLRWPDKPRTLWVDAICIDQSDLDERAAQVGMMREIYRRAARVVVWLGPPDADSRIAMAYARTQLDSATLVREYTAVFDAAGDSLQESALQGKTYFFDDEPDQSENGEFRDLAFAILRFLQRPWFNRVWIQQEAALCRDVRVFCGADAVEWDALFALAWVMHPRQAGGYPDWVQGTLGNVYHNLSAILEIQKFRGKLFPDLYGTRRSTSIYLLATLGSVRRFGATDPRDKIYAPLNLATDAGEWVAVDYRVPWQILYLDVARICLDNGWLDFLESAGKARHGPDVGGMLPSWAPDYRGRSDRDSLIREHALWMPGGGISGLGMARRDSIGSIHQLPKAHRRRMALPPEIKSFKGTRKQLLQSYASVKCTMSDEIVYLSKVDDEVPPVNPDGSAVRSYLLHIIAEDLQHVASLDPQTYLNHEAVSDAYKLTIILGRDAQGEIVGSDFVQAHWDNWTRWMESGSPEEWQGERKYPALESCVRESRIAEQFRFAVTRHGYFCLVTHAAALHDEVAIFPGYQLGVVLRPWQPQSQNNNEAEAEYHEFVGDAYVHGMMRNEAQCIIDEFGCKYKPSEAQWRKIAGASDAGRGEGWATLGFCGGYDRILPTLGLRRVKLV